MWAATSSNSAAPGKCESHRKRKSPGQFLHQPGLFVLKFFSLERSMGVPRRTYPQSLSNFRQISSCRIASSVAFSASTRCPPKSCAACSMCSFARRKAPSASRICGCGSAGVAAGGVAGKAFAAGVAGTFVLYGEAGVMESKR